MKKRGFTLIELLAVIVVLAIIALIATPIVMNVITKANIGAAERSADNYVKAVETLIATEKLDGTPLVDGTYTIESDGTIKGNGETYTVEVSGTKPAGGSVVIESGKVVKESTTINYEDYTVKYPNGKAEASEKETKVLVKLSDVCDFVSGTEKSIGAKYTCDLGDGERTFYVLELGSNPVSNSTLEENEVALILESNFDTTTQSLADAMGEKLDEIAGAWTKLDDELISLPSAEQIVVADGQKEDAYLNNPMLNSIWLCSGYWTSTPYTSSSGIQWVVSFTDRISTNVASIDNVYGVRPVITLSI